MPTTPAERAANDLLSRSLFTSTVAKLLEAAYLRGQADLLRDQRDAAAAERDRFAESNERYAGREHGDLIADDQRALARMYRSGAL